MIDIDKITLEATLVRGNYATIPIQNNIRDFAIGDKVYLTVKKELDDETPALQIIVEDFNEDGTCTIEIKPEDTADLDIGEYVYDITWEDDEGNPSTLLKNKCKMPVFKLIKGVTNG